MKQKLTYILIWAIIAVSLGFTTKPSLKYSSAPDKISFGVKIGILPTGRLTEFGIMYYNNRKLLSIQNIEVHQLMNIGTGKWPIPRTNVFHDYFEDYGFYHDSAGNRLSFDFQAAIDSLWKIRFESHPFDKNKGMGWSTGNFKPSMKQQKYIYDRYGVRGYDQDYFADTSFVQLLKDVVNPDWVAHYKSLR